MESTEVMKRINREIGQSINEESFKDFDKDTVAGIIEKIVEFMGTANFGSNFYIDRFDVTKGENKSGERLFYVKGSFYRHKQSEASYYAFNSKGECVGRVVAFVCNLVPPTQVEMEYWASREQYMNQGNMTILARDVIEEIFVDRAFDGFIVRDGGPMSKIDSILVAINETNYPSLAVAKKLGFDEEGILRMSDYNNQKGDQSSR